MKLFFFTVLILFTVTSHGSESNNYKLLYHQGADTKRIKGSIDELTEAIRDGKQIRLYIRLTSVEHAMDAGFISIFEGNIYAQIDEIQGQRLNRETKDIELRPYSKYVGLYSTKSPYEIKWFSF